MRVRLQSAIYLLGVVIFGGCANQAAKEQKTATQDSNKILRAVDTAPLSFAQPDTSTDPRYLAAIQFLATIRKPDVEKMEQEAYFRQFPGYSVDSFLSYFSKAKFSISDMEKGENDDETYSMEELKKELTLRKGPAFEVLAQMGYIYSIPYPQYSATNFEVRSDNTGIDVNMAGNYLLTFTKDASGVYKLSKVESDHISDQ